MTQAIIFTKTDSVLKSIGGEILIKRLTDMLFSAGISGIDILTETNTMPNFFWLAKDDHRISVYPDALEIPNANIGGSFYKIVSRLRYAEKFQGHKHHLIIPGDSYYGDKAVKSLAQLVEKKECRILVNEPEEQFLPKLGNIRISMRGYVEDFIEKPSIPQYRHAWTGAIAFPEMPLSNEYAKASYSHLLTSFLQNKVPVKVTEVREWANTRIPGMLKLE